MHRLTKLSLHHPVATLLTLTVVTVALASSLPSLQKEFGYRVLLGGDHPAIQRLEGMMDRYGGGYPAYVVWRCGDGAPCESVFDDESVRTAAAIEESLSSSPAITRVTSIASAPLLMPSPDGFAAVRLSDLDDPRERSVFFDRALEDPTWSGQLVSPDALTTAVVTSSPDARGETMSEVTRAVFEAVRPFQDAGWEFHFSGKPLEGIVAGRDLEASTQALTPVIAAIVATIVLLLTRSWQATLITMTGMGVALIWTFGFLAWMQWPQDSILEVLAPLIMTIGTCDAVHLLSRASARRSGSTPASPRDALLDSAAEVGPACVITTLTTAAALASFATSNLSTFVRFGVTAAFGTCACLILTFTLVPTLAHRLSLPGSRDDREGWHGVLTSILDTAERRALPILLIALIIAAFCGLGLATRLRIDTEVSEMYGDQNRVTQWTRFIEQHLRGLESLEVDIGLPSEEALLLPETHETISRIAELLEAQPGMGRATSVQDALARLNRVIHDDSPSYERTGDSTVANAELLELLGFDTPDVLNSWVSPDRKNLRISVEAASAEPEDSNDFAARMRAELDELVPEDWVVTLTGSYVLDMEWVDEVQQTQLSSFATAFLIVLAMVTVFLRSPLLGAAATIPAVFPVIVILGFLGWTNLPLDVGRLMIAAIVIGIGVDDSVHLLRCYQHHRALGRPPIEAMRAALHQVGRALVVTSVALSMGFVALTLSAWQTISSFGFFVSMAVLVSLAAALFVLPALFFVRQTSATRLRGAHDAGHEPARQ